MPLKQAVGYGEKQREYLIQGLSHFYILLLFYRHKQNNRFTYTFPKQKRIRFLKIRDA